MLSILLFYHIVTLECWGGNILAGVLYQSQRKISFLLQSVEISEVLGLTLMEMYIIK